MNPKNIRNQAVIKHVVDPHEWVNNHADYLFSFAIARIGNEDLARDLVQETFLSALEALERFEGRSTERTWLTAILKFKILDIYRKGAAGLPLSRDTASSNPEPVEFFEPENGHWKTIFEPKEFARSADDPLLSKEFQKVLKSCMVRLPALWLAVFTLKHIDESTTEFICNELNLSVANCWVIIHRAKLNLRACLQKNWV